MKNHYIYYLLMYIWICYLFFKIVIINFIFGIWNFFVFIRSKVFNNLIEDYDKITLKMINETIRLKEKVKTKYTLIKWFIMWVSLVYPKFLLYKFFFCLVRYLLKYFFVFIHYFIDENKLINKYDIFYTFYLMILLLEEFISFFFYTIPYKLSWFYISFRIIFIIDDLNHLVATDRLDFYLYPFFYFYLNYWIPYKEDSELIPEIYYKLKSSGLERKKLILLKWDAFLDILYTFYGKVDFSHETLVFKAYVKKHLKIYKKENNWYNKKNGYIYMLVELLNISYMFVWNLLINLLNLLNLSLFILFKLFKFFFLGSYYIIILLKWLLYRIIS